MAYVDCIRPTLTASSGRLTCDYPVLHPMSRLAGGVGLPFGAMHPGRASVYVCMRVGSVSMFQVLCEACCILHIHSTGRALGVFTRTLMHADGHLDTCILDLYTPYKYDTRCTMSLDGMGWWSRKGAKSSRVPTSKCECIAHAALRDNPSVTRGGSKPSRGLSARDASMQSALVVVPLRSVFCVVHSRSDV